MVRIPGDDEDAYGQAVTPYFEDNSGYEIIERNDIFIDFSAGPETYCREYENWPENERKAITYANGRERMFIPSKVRLRIVKSRVLKWGIKKLKSIYPITANPSR